METVIGFVSHKDQEYKTKTKPKTKTTIFGKTRPSLWSQDRIPDEQITNNSYPTMR